MNAIVQARQAPSLGAAITILFVTHRQRHGRIQATYLRFGASVTNADGLRRRGRNWIDAMPLPVTKRTNPA
jgi:hypothetical protein